MPRKFRVMDIWTSGFKIVWEYGGLAAGLDS